MIIPREVKVGNFVYDVEITDEPILLDYQVCMGICDSQNQVIRIDENLTGQNKERVFLHELFHAMTVDKELDFGEDTEHVIDTLAKSLHGVLVDNPMLFVDENILEKLLDELEDEDEEEEECCSCSCCD